RRSVGRTGRTMAPLCGRSHGADVDLSRRAAKFGRATAYFGGAENAETVSDRVDNRLGVLHEQEHVKSLVRAAAPKLGEEIVFRGAAGLEQAAVKLVRVEHREDQRIRHVGNVLLARSQQVRVALLGDW